MVLPKYVTKRDASTKPFRQQKVEDSIWIAAKNVGGKDRAQSKMIAREVFEYLSSVYPAETPIRTSDIGSAIEKVLVHDGHYLTVREFILAREKKREEFTQKTALGIQDDIGHLSYNSLFILKERYLWKDEQGKTIETPNDMLKRIARFVAQAETTAEDREIWENAFYQIMRRWEFLPGTRALANAGKENAQMANCFVFDVEDDIEDVFEKLYHAGITKRHGGGCGYNFSKLRFRGDSVAGEHGLAAGPVKIISMFDLQTSVFKQQGKYESGNMAIVNVDHPDILEFIATKEKDGVLSKTNISIGITDAFVEAVKKGIEWPLINPRNREVVNKVKARVIWEIAVNYAYNTGDPGIIFIDNLNKDNPVREQLGPIQTTNPCGEIPCYPYESCNLGYLNLTKFVKNSDDGVKFIDLEGLASTAKVATRFMDDVIDVSWFPVGKQTETVRNFRRIGIGVVGWADVLVDLKIPYDSEKAFILAEKVSKTIADACHQESYNLGKLKGPFPFVKYSKWANQKDQPRNVATNTLPPSSGNAVIFDTSFSTEPFFALAYYQNILGGIRVKNINTKLEKVLKSAGIEVENLFERIFENHGSVQHINEIPADIKELFLTAHEIHWQDHLKMQAAWQKHIDNAITKTINMPSSATTDDVSRAYMMAWELGCKGITIYRDQSKKNQVIEFGNQREYGEGEGQKLREGEACPECGASLICIEGCVSCLGCDFSYCGM